MKVLVVGGGVIGVTTAYYLAEAGHEVVVCDRQMGPAQETSYANAGEISAGYAGPLAAPGVPLKALKWLAMKDSPLVLRPKFDPKMWLWLAKMLRNCTASRYAANKALMMPLAAYSRDMLRVLRAATGISYDERSQGTLQLFRSQEQLDHAAADVSVLDSFEVPYEILDADGCIAAEPALAAARGKIAGGLRLPDDETGDCRLFTERLTELCVRRGVVFEFGRKVTSLRSGDGKIHCAATAAGAVEADAFVLATGSYSERFMRKLAPARAGLSAQGLFADRADRRCRGGAGVDGHRRDPQDCHNPARRPRSHRRHRRAVGVRSDPARIAPCAARAFAGRSVSRGRRPREANFWCGLRPMTPDGPPIIGRTRMSNLFINTGHGMLGWTMACGSGKVLADIMSGREPEVDVGGLGPERYWN